MRAIRPPIPRDDALPAMPRMLDVDAMAPVLERSLGGGRSIDSVAIRYVRYKQGRSLLVRYEVLVDGADHGVVALADAGGKLAEQAGEPANLELAAKAADRTPARAPLAYEDDPGILVQWPPMDLALPTMAERPDRLRQILEDAGVRTRVQGERPQLVHFKPSSRAVLRYGDHFVKIYADDKSYEGAVAGMLAANALPMRSARCEAAIPELRLTAQSLVAGAPPPGPVEAAPAAGAFLAMLHGSENDTVVATPAARRLRAAASSARLLAAIEPRLAPRLEVLLRSLEESMPDEPLVLSHGDFFVRQMLELGGDYGVIDFDACCRAPAALDIATYISSLVRGVDDLPAGMAALEVLCEAYGRQPAGVPWFLTTVLLRRALIPFRVFSEDWPDEIEARVRCAEAALTV